MIFIDWRLIFENNNTPAYPRLEPAEVTPSAAEPLALFWITKVAPSAPKEMVLFHKQLVRNWNAVTVRYKAQRCLQFVSW